MTASPLYDRGYYDALSGRVQHDSLRFYWAYRLGFKIGIVTRENRAETIQRAAA